MKDNRTGRAALWAAGLLGMAALAANPSTASPAPSAGMDAALTQRVTENSPKGLTSVIVRTNDILTEGQKSQLTALGADTYRDLPIIHSVALRLPTRNLKALAALPFVTHLSYDGQIKKCDEFTVASSGASTAWAAPYKMTGQGVTVAIVDSGINASRPDLQAGPFLGLQPQGNRLAAAVSFVSDATGKTLNANDQCGHGTHVAGIVAGNGSASTGTNFTHTFYGVAPLVNLVSVRVLDANGGGTVSSVVAGLQWVVANRAAYKIRVLNLSLGHPVGESYRTDPLCQGVEAAWRAGIVVVCAAGNEGRLNATQAAGAANEGWGAAYGSIQSPGNDPYVITVGATKSMDGNRADDRVATYSSRGPSRLDLVCKPDILAPGNRVISLDANQSTLDQAVANQLPMTAYNSKEKFLSNGKISGDYFVLSGTSMASPVVAGAAALLLQKYPTLSPDTVKARLMLSADKQPGWYATDGSYDPLTYGAGYLNIPAALSSTFTASGEYAVSPSLSIDGSGNVTVNDDHAPWGSTTVNTSHALWGKSALWGSNGITDLSALWGSHALWGKSTLASSHALWGCSVWSDHALWGCNVSSVDLTSTALKGE